MKDASQQLAELTIKFTRRWDFREDLAVEADGLETCVKVNGVQHNVGTVREYVKLLTLACDFVEQANPKWAASTNGYDDDPVELICEHGHLTYGTQFVCGYRYYRFGEHARCGSALTRVVDGAT